MIDFKARLAAIKAEAARKIVEQEQAKNTGAPLYYGKGDGSVPVAPASLGTPTPPPAPPAPTITPSSAYGLLNSLREKAANAKRVQQEAAQARTATLNTARTKEMEAKAKVLALIEAARAKKTVLPEGTEVVSLTLPNTKSTAHILSTPITTPTGETLAPLKEVLSGGASTSTRAVTFDQLNEKQKEAVRLATIKQPFVLIGSAGSGKTTTTEVAVTHLASTGFIPKIKAGQHTKNLFVDKPAIAITSFTNQAVTNIKEIIPEEYKGNCLTIHKLLEYEPEYFEIEDKENGGLKKTMRYVPRRTSLNQIPKLTVCIIEEAGSVSVELFHRLEAACPKDTIFIFLGDLNQIPPVFGDAILGYKILELPVVELTQVYRQETDSPIKKLAYRILDGIPISDAGLEKFNTPGTLEFFPFLVQKTWEQMISPGMPEKSDAGKHFRSLVRNHFTGGGKSDLDRFDYTKDVLLIPFNKQLGTIELNKHIAQEVTEQLGSPTYEIFAGFNKLYYAIGDIVYWNKAKWRIVDIEKNPFYSGPIPRVASTDLNRWGLHKDELRAQEEVAAAELESLEDALALVGSISGAAPKEADKALHQASHRVKLSSMDEDFPDTWISLTGDISDMYLAYCLTVHKAQGSEWEKVFCLFHSSHAVLLQREILYTAVTRARKQLRIYYDGEKAAKKGNSVFQRGIVNQKIPGNTLEEKLKYFRDKLHAVAIQQGIADAKKRGVPFNLGAIRAISDKDLVQGMLKDLYKKIEEENEGVY